jgi:hypothetical protein
MDLIKQLLGGSGGFKIKNNKKSRRSAMIDVSTSRYSQALGDLPHPCSVHDSGEALQ